MARRGGAFSWGGGGRERADSERCLDWRIARGFFSSVGTGADFACSKKCGLYKVSIVEDYLGGDDLARGYEKYAKRHQLNIWTSTRLEKADFNSEDKTWTLHIARNGTKQTLRTPHLVLAIGAGGSIPSMPQLPNRVRALESFTDTGLWFADGSVLDADVIVFCTGFERDARKEAARIVGQEIGDKLEDYWGLDQEGELRGVYKRISYPGIWYHGGGVTWSRFYSRFLVLQIKADIEGAPLEVYGKKMP